jgi:NAD(P)-dependent dehydrogenase (short-subunit alcohol dehydrogenase family)
MENPIKKAESLKENVVLITGALSGIGRASALAFAEEGAKIVVSGRKEDEGKALVQELESKGTEALFFKTDVRYDHEVKALIDGVITRFGRIDIAVNNAGTEGQPGLIVNQSPESYAATFDTNVLGTLLCLKYELEQMIKQGSGSIVNVSSTFGSRASIGTGLYGASKHAVEGLTKTAALEGAPYGIRVNAVAPGPVETELLKRVASKPEVWANLGNGVPLKRIGQPEEIAQAIVFLGSDKSPFLTGQILGVDGGKSAADSGSKVN